MFPSILFPFLLTYSIFSVNLYDWLLKNRPQRDAILFVVTSLAINAYMAVYALATYAEIWGPGIYLACFSVPIAVILCINWTRKFVRDYKDKLAGKTTYYLVAVGGFAVAAMQLSPAIGFLTLSNICYSRTERVGEQIAQAMDLYKSNSGSYPDDIDLLVPNFFDEVPPHPCGTLFQRNTFRVEMCDSGETLLVIFLLNVYRYNLDTKVWSQIDWLEGSPCFLLQ